MMPPCVGKVYYHSDRREGRHTLFVAVPCRIGSVGRPIFGLLDTGSQWCVLPPDLVAELGEEIDLVPAGPPLLTRFGALTGSIGRVTIHLDAAEGESIAIDATCFVSEDWPGFLVIGWKGCLERMRFGLDPGEDAFYFGGL
jgi:hypothetical protein